VNGGILVGAEWHPLESGLKSWYLGGSVYAEYDTNPNTAATALDNYFVIGIGASAGYHFLFSEHLTLDLGIGAKCGFTVGNWPAGPALAPFSFYPVIDIGYWF
jgi:hypothetical protein